MTPAIRSSESSDPTKLLEEALRLVRFGQEDECRNYLERAAAQGHTESQFELGVFLEGLEDEVAADLFNSAAEKGHALAKQHLGLCYAEGRGVEVDLRQAESLLTEASQAGCPPTGLTYQQCLRYFSTSENAFSVGWMDGHEAQWIRFETLLGSISANLGEDEEFGEFLDLGCGCGHLVDFCKETGIDGLMRYTGCDNHADAVARARIRHPGHCFVDGDIFVESLEPAYDWILCSGVFNIGIPEGEMLGILDEVALRASKGFVANFLLAPYEQHEGYEAYDPTALVAELRSRVPFVGFKIQVQEHYGIDDEFSLTIVKV